MRPTILSVLLFGCGVATLDAEGDPAARGLPDVEWTPEGVRPPGAAPAPGPAPSPEPPAPDEQPEAEGQPEPEAPAPDLPPDPAPEEPAPEEDPPEAPPPEAPAPDDEPYAGDPCEGLDYLGECVGSLARWCADNGELRTRECGLEGCGWVDDELGWFCGGDPDHDPDAPPPEPPPPVEGCGSPEEAEVVRLVNESRQQRGLGALDCEPAGTTAARLHSEDMCDHRYFSHTGRDGSSAGDRLRRAGARFGGWGENIAYGQRDAAEVHRTWMNSPGHHANIMGRYRRIGVGLAPCGGRNYWTEVFLD